MRTRCSRGSADEGGWQRLAVARGGGWQLLRVDGKKRLNPKGRIPTARFIIDRLLTGTLRNATRIQIEANRWLDPQKARDGV
jgi:hypothetical protein